MPQRTTPFQMTVHAIRDHCASHGVRVTESKLLLDAQTGKSVEVDIVLEGDFDGEHITTSLEVIEHKRKATLAWVRSMIAKHRHLPTNKLILVSKSGFVHDALKVVAAENGKVRAVVPEIQTIDGSPVVKRLYADRVGITVERVELTVVMASDGELRVLGEPRHDLYSEDRKTVGSVGDLVRGLLDGELGVALMKEAHNHPSRETVTGFSCGRDVSHCCLQMLSIETGELALLRTVDMFGSLTWSQREIPFIQCVLDGRQYGAAEVDLFGVPTVWVSTPVENGRTTITWRATPKGAKTGLWGDLP